MSSTRLFFAFLMLLSGCTFETIEPPPPPPCRPPTLAGPPAGDVPANWPFFAVTYPASNPGAFDWRDVGLMRLSDGRMVPGAPQTPLSGTDPTQSVRAFVPYERLVPGEDYDFLQPFCFWSSEDPPITHYHTVAPIPEPTVLGTIEVSRIYAANAVRGIPNRVYFVVITLTPDPEATVEPWATSMQWRPVSVVDGTEELWRRFDQVSIQSATARITITCDWAFGTDYGIPPGAHTLRGTTGAVAIRITTPDVATVIDPCESALRVDNETLVPLTPEEVTFWDTE